MSSVAAESVPCPREVWRAALDGRRITVSVESDHQSVEPGVGEDTGSGWTVSGDIIDRRKVGDEYDVSVSVTFVPDGELAAIELEAVKERGEWTAFRAFAYQHFPGIGGGRDGAFQYAGTVSNLDIPEGRWNTADEIEVTA